MKVLHSFETSGFTYTTIENHIPEDLDPQQFLKIFHREIFCDNVKRSNRGRFKRFIPIFLGEPEEN